MVLFFMIRMQPLRQTTLPDPIAVSLLPQSERPAPPAAPATPAAPVAPAAPAAKAKPAPPRAKAPTILNKKEPNVDKQITAIPAPLALPTNPVPRPAAEPAGREPIQDRAVIVERPLPTLKELLPSPTYSSANTGRSEAVSLNTRDPTYVNYFTAIKQNIEQQWEYPEVALRYGLQGRLSLEFTISGTGHLEQLRMIRSSGSQVLDAEALRAIKAAAPFPPIPSWIRPVPLSISASMEYHDNRLNYRPNR